MSTRPTSSAGKAPAAASTAKGSSATRPPASSTLKVPGQAQQAAEDSIIKEGTWKKEMPRLREARNSLAGLVDNLKTDPLTQIQLELSQLKNELSSESKKNFVREKTLKILDNKIALLVKNRISLEEVESDAAKEDTTVKDSSVMEKDQKVLYGSLFLLLQEEPDYLAKLTGMVSLGEIDNLLQSVMFTIYGNQYEAHDEHMLLILFQTVLRDECTKSESLGSLFRGNTAITRMMTTYTRRGPGQEYLKKSIGPLLQELVTQKDFNLEINPIKVYEQYLNDYEVQNGKASDLPRSVTSEVAAENPNVQAIIASRIPQLIQISQRFVDCMLQSLSVVPYGVRWICKQIHVLVSAKFTDATPSELASLVGGFYMLRFVNPAIATPFSFHLVEKNPDGIPRKNCTFIAKVLQQLSNNTIFGEKETYMKPLNTFLETNQAKMIQFYSDLINVADPHEALEFDEYLQMTQAKESVMTITINEVYQTHRLLVKHRAALVPEGDEANPLAKHITALGDNVPEDLPRPNNHPTKLALNDAFALPSDQSEAQQQATPQLLYSECKSLLFHLIRAYPPLRFVQSDFKDALRSVIAQGKKQTAQTAPAPTPAPAPAPAPAAAGLSGLASKTPPTGSAPKPVETPKGKAPTPATPEKAPSLSKRSASTSASKVLEEPKAPAAAAPAADPLSGMSSQQIITAGGLALSIAEPSGIAEHVIGLLEQLEVAGLVSPSDNYAALRVALAEELANVDGKIAKLKSQVAELKVVKATLLKQQQEIEDQINTWQVYLDNVRTSAYKTQDESSQPKLFGSSSKKTDKTEKCFSHPVLVKDGVIHNSEVPKDRVKDVYFCFSSPQPGLFDLVVRYKTAGRTKDLDEMALKLDELLEMQHNNELFIEMDYLEINVNMLLHLLKREFIQK